MATVNEYLKKLLYQYDCIVVPELGAFLTHQQSASFTESSGLYLPPRKRLAFNEALRLDDGILMNYLMLHEQLNRDEAQRRIATFVADLRRGVQETGRFEVDGVGTFTQNEETRLQFEPSLRHNFFGEAYGMTPVSAQLVNSQIEPVAIEAVPVRALGPVLLTNVVEETALVPNRRYRYIKEIAAAIVLVGSLGALVLEPGQPLQSSLNPANLLAAVPAVFKTDETSSDLKPVLVKSERKAVAVVKPVTPAVPPTTPSVAISTPALTEAAKMPVVKPTVAPAPAPVLAKSERTSPHFTVIAGSFSSKRNALRLQRRLRKAGYEDAYIIPPIVKGQLFKVAAAGSDIRTEALTNLGQVSKLTGAQAWILKN